MFNSIITWILSTNLYKKFARHWLAYFTFRIFGWTKFPLGKYFDIRKIAKSMDGHYGLLAFVSCDKQILNYKLNHLLTGCKWGHAGLVYCGADGELRTKEMINSGLTDQYLVDLLREVDDFSLLWLPMTPENFGKAQQRIDRLDTAPEKVEYDFLLQLDDTLMKWVRGEVQELNTGEKKPKFDFRAYCSGYVYMVAHGLVEDPDFKTSWVMGREVFEPDDVYKGADVLYEGHFG